MPEEKNAPWIKNYGKIKFHLEYPVGSMSDVVFATADENADSVAVSCNGTKVTYKALKKRIVETAKAYLSIGVKPGDVVTLCMPNLLQTVYSLYALNYIGAIVSMIHPLSAEAEIAHYLKEVRSEYVLTLYDFYDKIVEAEKLVDVKTVVLSGAADELGFFKKSVYNFVNGKKRNLKNNVVTWKELKRRAKRIKDVKPYRLDENETAVILFSGGTTGMTKGVRLSSKNFNSQAAQTEAMCSKPVRHKKMLAAMPCFHGFGLGVCVHTMLVAGGESMLVPRFNVKEYAELIKKRKPNYIAGVPTLYEALTRGNYLDGVDLSCLMGVFSGGDKLTADLKKKFDKFLADHGATVKVREGYGMTECVAASCLTPYDREKEGLSALGHKSGISRDYDPEVLETFANQHPENDYWVRFNCPEFTTLCPITGQPDFAEIRISYIPGERMVESKSLKLYLFSFRNHGDFHEDCVNTIMKDLIALMDPKYIEVTGFFTPRGGISIYPYVNYGRPGTKYEDLASRRFATHE